MPSMLEHESNSLSKLLVVADSGSGKTGSLAPLVDDGYNIRVLDFDNGMSVLKGFVKKRENLGNVHYIVLRDEFQLRGGMLGIKKAAAFQRAMDALDKGGDLWGEGSGIPPLKDWGPKDILVVDSLGLMGRASLNMVLQANGVLAKPPEIQHWGTAMENIEKFIGQITSDSVGCNVIVNTHTYTPNNSTRPAPSALGDKLGPQVPKYFDNMIALAVVGGKRQFRTKSDGLLALKTSVPMQDTYPIETGYRDIFKALQGG